MTHSNLPHTMFSGLDNDIRAEVMAAELVEQGLPPDRIMILMLGALKRTFSKDVESLSEELSEYDHREYTILKTTREGIYDMLPEGLFHDPASFRSAGTEKDIIKVMKLRKEEERNARKFFLPFEATINFLRMQMALYENRLDKRSHYDDLVDIFKDQWEIFRYLNPKQSNIFLHLIPILHNMRDDHPVVEKLMEMIFEVPVTVHLRNQLPVHPASPVYSRMGGSLLGVDLTTGNEVYDEGVEEILITIGPLSNQSLRQFMPGQTNAKILELLSDYLLPVHLDLVTELLLDEKYRVTRLADAASDLNAALGADTFL